VNARYYDATIGRFINVDPIQDGWNWYVYCNNNPLKFVDPSGLKYKYAEESITWFTMNVKQAINVWADESKSNHSTTKIYLSDAWDIFSRITSHLPLAGDIKKGINLIKDIKAILNIVNRHANYNNKENNDFNTGFTIADYLKKLGSETKFSTDFMVIKRNERTIYGTFFCIPYKIKAVTYDVNFINENGDIIGYLFFDNKKDVKAFDKFLKNYTTQLDINLDRKHDNTGYYGEELKILNLKNDYNLDKEIINEKKK